MYKTYNFANDSKIQIFSLSININIYVYMFWRGSNEGDNKYRSCGQ